MVYLRIATIFQIVLFYSIAIASPTNPFGTGWQIQIRSAAVVYQDKVTLADIGIVHGTPPPGAWEKLSSIPLWNSPQHSGVPLKINRVKLQTALKESIGEAASLCILPSTLTIQKNGTIVYENQLRTLTKKAIEEASPDVILNGDITDYRLPPYIFLAKKSHTVSVVLPTVEAKRLPLHFEIKDMAGNTIRQYTGTVLVYIWKTVPTIGKPLNKGDYLDPKIIIWERKNKAFLKEGLWDGKGGPWQVKKALGTGQVIYISDIEALAVIRKNAILNLVYSNGAVTLTTKAQALEEGLPGQTIEVRNLQSNKIVYAKVKDANTVEVK